MGGASIWDYESYASLGRVHGEREREREREEEEEEEEEKGDAI